MLKLYLNCITGGNYNSIAVANNEVSEHCRDYPLSANCNHVVRKKWCKANSYAKFCCRSCTLAGQLNGGDILVNH